MHEHDGQRRRRRVGLLATGAAVALLTGLGTGTAAFAAPAQSADSLTLTPNSGPTGTSVQVDGVLSCPDVPVGGSILIRFVDLREAFQTGTNLTYATKQADSSFSTTVTVPSLLAQLQPGVGIFDFPVVPGTNHIEASCTQSSTGGVPTIGAPFTVTQLATTTTAAPTTTTTTTAPPFVAPPEPPADAGDFTGPLPGAKKPGEEFLIDERGFAPDEEVVIVLYSDPKVLTTVNADSTGRVLVAVAVPADTEPGAHTVVVFGETKTIKAPLTVEVLSAQTPTQSTLPRTGAAVAGGSAGLGLILVAAGTAVVLASRRRAAAG